MVFFDRNDLEYEYVWLLRPADEAVINYRGPYYVSLDRENGYEVLHFINYLGKQYNFCDKRTCKKVERMLHFAPAYISSQDKMRQWILRNWCSFQ